MKSIRNSFAILFTICSVLSLQPPLFAQVERAELAVVGMVCNL